MERLTCYKAYDVRGKLGEELNDKGASNIGRAFAQHLNAKRVVVGSDIRPTSNSLKKALAKGLMDSGADVIDIGMTGTEEIYFAASHLDVDGGIEITASHNPMDYNGMKFVGRGALPISGDTGLKEIQHIAESQNFEFCSIQGSHSQLSILDEYIEHLFGYINVAKLKPLKLVVYAGNGAAVHVIDAIESRFKLQNIPVEFIKIHHQPDGSFPNGIPNPLLPENRKATADAVLANQADMGIAWDGDFDSCFLFGENGEFIEGYFIVGLLAEAFLNKNPGEKVIHDPRLTWNTIDIVKRAGGIPVQSKTGHASIEERMRAEDTIYGGEMSSHHYFRDFAYCDSGMIPWLLVSELICITGNPLSKLVGERMAAYPSSGEINYKVKDTNMVIEKILAHYSSDTPSGMAGGEHPDIDTTDSISLEFSDWRLNLRASNTEPLLRLNVESRGNQQTVEKRTAEIETLIKDKG